MARKDSTEAVQAPPALRKMLINRKDAAATTAQILAFEARPKPAPIAENRKVETHFAVRRTPSFDRGSI